MQPGGYNQEQVGIRPTSIYVGGVAADSWFCVPPTRCRVLDAVYDVPARIPLPLSSPTVIFLNRSEKEIKRSVTNTTRIYGCVDGKHMAFVAQLMASMRSQAPMVCPFLA